MTPVIVKDSRIQGKGIFANRDFKRGEVVIMWDSLLNNMDKTAVKSPSSFLNHSCNANLAEINGKNVAVREIKKGEEITCNYITESVPFLKLDCNCGSGGCKKIIVGEILK